ncbi:MAG: hypothetical protein IKE02_03805 [Lachnospiraceae bacterium]|nr:hypothetical protein [Lachnospiraceae bacterium]
MIQATKMHNGQYKRYGDSFYVWLIDTGSEALTKEQVVQWAFDNLNSKRTLPIEAEWRHNAKFDGPRGNDPCYYFDGYYTIRRTDVPNTWEFTICRPYCD